MPNIAPTKVNISPDETSTDECISPNGATTKPATRRPAPTIIITTAHTSCTLSLFSLSISLSFLCAKLQADDILASAKIPKKEFFHSMQA